MASRPATRPTIGNSRRGGAAGAGAAGSLWFRHFRIIQTGKNSGGYDFLNCAGIELYGTLTEKQKPY
jgi:hypothetical protein